MVGFSLSLYVFTFCPEGNAMFTHSGNGYSICQCMCICEAFVCLYAWLTFSVLCVCMSVEGFSTSVKMLLYNQPDRLRAAHVI